jgi:nucleoside-diphosphate-sugar epimerase
LTEKAMGETIFLAGGSGVVGLRLIPLLVADGWRVIATTRTPEKAPAIRALGGEPAIVDVFEVDDLASKMVAARPAVVMHQLTSLPDALAAGEMEAARPRNARIRDEGTRNLIAASLAAGARRIVAQSICFAYAAGAPPFSEDDPLDSEARGVASLERRVRAAPIEGLILRYGHFYGPGTGADQAPGPGSLHVDSAAEVARMAARRGRSGIYNIAEDDGFVLVRKAEQEFGWKATKR